MTQGMPQYVDVGTDTPPPAPLVTPTGREGCEVGQWKQPFPQPANTSGNRSFSQEISVYTTKARRRGVDVYVSTDSAVVIPATGVLVVRVYGRSGDGAQSLVASGLCGFEFFGTVLGLPANRARWVCAARAAVEIFDVTIQYYDSGTFPNNGNLIVTTVASDEVVEPPPHIGVTTAANIVSGGGSIIDLGFFNVGKVAIPGLELVSVYGANDSTTPGSPRYLQAFDRFASLAAGTHAQYVWPMGGATGGGIQKLHVGKRFHLGLILAVSSTSDVYTSVSDSTIQAEIR